MSTQVGFENYPTGRNWMTASRASLTTTQFGPYVKLEWNDGKFLIETFDFETEARSFLRRMGFIA